MDQENQNFLAYYDLAIEPIKSAQLQSLKEIDHRYNTPIPMNAGGMKKILSSQDLATERQVAMAVLHKPKDQQAIDAFIREARIGASLEHPNIVPIYDLGLNDDDEPYFIMKKLSGQTLRDLLELDKNTKKSSSEVELFRLLDIFLKVCDAIAYAHHQGIVHLDIKPSNIQIDDYGQVQVCDWGLALELSSQQLSVKGGSETGTESTTHETLNGRIMGSPGFMAPEQIESKNGSRGIATDIYALGALLYAILTKRPPIHAENLDSLIEKTLKGEIEPSPDIKPKPLIAVALKAMNLDQARRYSGVNELMQEIHSFQQCLPTRAEEAKPFQNLSYYLRRNRRMSLVIIIALISLLSLGSLFLIKFKHQRDLAQTARVEAEQAQEKKLHLVKVLEHEKLTQTATAHKAARGIMPSALNLYDKNNFKKSLETVDYILSLDPDFKKAWSLKGKLLFGAFRFEEAIPCLERAENKERFRWLKSLAQATIQKNGPGLISMDTAWNVRQQIIESHKGLNHIHVHLLHTMVETYPLEERFEIARRSYLYNHIKVGGTKENFKFDLSPLEDKTYALSVSGNSGTSMSIIITELPLSELNLSGTGIKSLNYLKRMPLKKLNLSYTNVDDIKDLKDLALEEIDIQGTYVNRLDSLKNSPLQIINLPDYPISLKPLKQIPTLQKIILPRNIYSDELLKPFGDKIEFR